MRPSNSLTASDITDLFLSQPDLSAKDARWFTDQGVDTDAILRTLAGGICPIKKGRVATAGDHFEFQPDGVTSYLFLALDQWFQPVDIVSWGKLGTRSYMGRAAVLGEDALGEARVVEALDVFLTPIEWLRAGRMGLLVVQPGRCRDVLVDAQPLKARSMDHAAELVRLMARKMEVTW